MFGSATSNRIAAELRDESTQPKAIEEISKAFRKTKGIATKAAEALGVSHRALSRWMKTYPALEKKVREIRKHHDARHEVGDKIHAKE